MDELMTTASTFGLLAGLPADDNPVTYIVVKKSDGAWHPAGSPQVKFPTAGITAIKAARFQIMEGW